MSQSNQYYNYLIKSYAAVTPNVHYLVRVRLSTAALVVLKILVACTGNLW